MTDVHIVKAMVFPVVMYGCESCTRKQAEHRRTGASKLWCWRRLESPLDCKEIQPVNPKGNQSWIFIRRTDVEAEASILGPPKTKSWLTRKGPDVGKDERQKNKGLTEHEMVQWHYDSMDMNLSNFWEMVKDREAWHAAVHGVAKSWTWLSDWITKTMFP